MKKLLLLSTFAFFLFIFSFAQQYGWQDISDNIPTEASLSDVFFVSDNEGWITSSSIAEIYHTTDGGLTFEIQTTQYSTNAIHMLNMNEGFSGGSQGRVYRTVNGGNNWNAIGGIGVTLTDMSFPFTGDTGYACGDGGAVFSITTGAVSNLHSGLGLPFAGISSPSINNVWICGSSSIYYYNGVTFTEQPSPTGSFSSIYFINNQQGWVVGTDGIIANTINAGTDWVVQTNPDSNSLFGIFFLDENNGWAVGVNGTILHTTNGGNTWLIEGNGLTTAFLTGVHFTSPTNGYVFGNDKTLLKYGEISGIDDGVETMTFEIFPNPAVSVISLQSAVFSQQSAVVEISDMHGRKLLEKQIPKGSETVEVDVSSLASGVYFCRLISKNKSASKKLIIQK